MLNKYRYFLIIFFLSVFFGILIKILRVSYNSLFQNNIISNFLNCMPSFFATTGMCMLVLIIVKKQQVKTMGFVVFGLLIYETEQYWTYRIFDMLDIIAIILGYLASILVFKIFKEKDELQ